MWKPIPGYEESYEISTEGRVRSITKTFTYTMKTKWGGVCEATRTRPGRILKCSINDRTGYMQITLHDSKSKTKKTHKLHRLVLTTFVGPAPSTMDGCHGPGGKLDNRITNLRWDTRVGNTRDRIEAGTQRYGRPF